MHKTTGCFICGKPLEYFNDAQKLSCMICKKSFESNAACEDGHFVCDKCHAKQGVDFITEHALTTENKNPLSIALEIMKNQYINMHGPEHHYLVAAALLAAYKNAGGKIDLKKSLKTAAQRAKNVPGGICGLWGSCGAGVGAGIFVSVATNATPLSEQEWSLANLMTSQALGDIAKSGGPRCCKRNTFLAIGSAVRFVKENFAVELETQNNIYCGHFPRNEQCKKENCQFYPKKVK